MATRRRRWEVMEAFATGPDGRYFWRPWRATYLTQIAMLGPLLPAWVTSRWICGQALQSLPAGRQDVSIRAFERAAEVRGGLAALPGADAADAHGRVIDHDWVYRQLFLYDLGGLDLFVREKASSTLLARADSVREWGRGAMGGASDSSAPRRRVSAGSTSA